MSDKFMHTDLEIDCENKRYKTGRKKEVKKKKKKHEGRGLHIDKIYPLCVLMIIAFCLSIT